MRKSNAKAEHGILRVRKATAKDVPTIARLIRALAKYEKLDRECHASSRRLFRHGFSRARQPYFETLIAERDGKPIGLALYVLMYSTFRCSPILYIEDLFVIPEARGKEVGKTLLGELARVAVRRGCGQIKWMVLDWNEPAFRFYRTLGAKTQKEWVLMRLNELEIRRLARNA
jgi:GNAT superfamily N-acetyltransferase